MILTLTKLSLELEFYVRSSGHSSQFHHGINIVGGIHARMHASPVQLYTILYANAPHQLRVEIEDSSWPEQKNLEERKEEASFPSPA